MKIYFERCILNLESIKDGVKQMTNHYTDKAVTLTTYDDSDPEVDKNFTIPTDYAREKIMQKRHQTLEYFLDNYTLEDTEWLLIMAKIDGVLIS